MKGKNDDCVDKGLNRGKRQERLAPELLSDLECLADQNDFSNHERLDKGLPIVRHRRVIGLLQNHAVCYESAKEEGQIKDDYHEFSNLVGSPCFQTLLWFF